MIGVLLMWVSAASADGSQEMVTSWYGERFRGRPTASGEIYDPDQLTAAHPSLPFGTLLDVTHPRTGVTVRVRVNDRGPFIHGRHLDVSEAAATALGMRDEGVARLDVVVLGRS